MPAINVVVSVRGLTGAGKSTVMKIITKALKQAKLNISEVREQRTLETIDVYGEPDYSKL